MAIEKLKRFRSPGSHQIPAELIKSWHSTIRFEIHKCIFFWIRKNCLSSGRSQLLYIFIRRVIK
jgi:hypothetical protein